MKLRSIIASFLMGTAPLLLVFLTLFLLVHAPFHHVNASDNANWQKPSDDPETLGDKHERLKTCPRLFPQGRNGVYAKLAGCPACTRGLGGQ